MPKVYENVYGTSRAKGNFLASEVGKKLETRDFTSVAATLGVDEVDAYGKTIKVIKKGMVYPTNGSTAEGIVFEDVYPNEDGLYIGSLMTGGYVWKQRLEVEIASAAVTTLKALGLYVVEHYNVSRPDFGTNELVALATPTSITNTGTAISWGTVANATGYIVLVNGILVGKTEETTITLEAAATGGSKIEVIALGDYVTYKNSSVGVGTYTV